MFCHAISSRLHKNCIDTVITVSVSNNRNHFLRLAWTKKRDFVLFCEGLRGDIECGVGGCTGANVAEAAIS